MMLIVQLICVFGRGFESKCTLSPNIYFQERSSFLSWTIFMKHLLLRRSHSVFDLSGTPLCSLQSRQSIDSVQSSVTLVFSIPRRSISQGKQRRTCQGNCKNQLLCPKYLFLCTPFSFFNNALQCGTISQKLMETVTTKAVQGDLLRCKSMCHSLSQKM